MATSRARAFAVALIVLPFAAVAELSVEENVKAGGAGGVMAFLAAQTECGG